MGGADAFRLFLENEVKPFVHARYDAREDGATIFGSSLGELFVTHTFLTAPATFDNFIAVDPALRWNQDEIFEIVPGRTKLSPEYPANVFVAAGSFEESPEMR